MRSPALYLESLFGDTQDATEGLDTNEDPAKSFPSDLWPLSTLIAT